MSSLPADEFAYNGQPTQVVEVGEAVVLEYLPLSHSSHEELPVDALYLPTSHASHVPPSGPEYPAMHLQSVALVLAFHDVEFQGHAKHVLRESAATDWEYVSFWHDVQATDPLVSL